MAVMGGRVIPMFTNNGVPGAQARRHERLENVRAGQRARAARRRPRRGCTARRWSRCSPLCTAAHAARWRCGSRGARCARRWCGCCTPPTRGSCCTWRCACWPNSAGSSAVGRHPRADRRRDRRPDHRHDDAHRARPHRRGRCSPTASTWPATCASWSRRWCAWRCRWWRRAPPSAPSMLSGWLWSCGFGLFTLRYAPMLLRPRLDGKPG